MAITADAPFEPIVDRTQILEEQRKDEDIQEIILNLKEDQENSLGYSWTPTAYCTKAGVEKKKEISL